MGLKETFLDVQRITNPFFEDMWGLNNPMPDYKLSELDPQSAALKDKMMARAERPASDIASETLQGTDKGGLLKASLDQQKAQNQSLGNADEDAAISERINQRAQKDYQNSMGDLNRRVQHQAPVERSQRMAGGADLQAKINQMDSALVDRELQNTLNRRAARNATIGNILGIGGAVVGGMAAGPQGAKAGMAIGGSMGGNKTEYTMAELDASRAGRKTKMNRKDEL